MERATVVVVIFLIGFGFYLALSDPVFVTIGSTQQAIGAIFIVLGVLYYLIID
jgi:hypothetical protein